MQSSLNPRRLFSLATLCAVAATVFAYFALFRRGEQRVLADTPVQVLTAARDLPAGTLLRPEMVQQKTLPASAVPEDALRLPEEVANHVAARSLVAGDVISRRALQQASATLGLSYVLPPLTRAVTVSVDAASGIGGFLKPGDRVDVLGTFSRGERTDTRLVLQNIPVVAVGSVTQRETATAGKPAPVQGEIPVTLAVTVPQAEQLVLADSRGEIRLALRPVGDQARVESPGVSEGPDPAASPGTRAVAPSATAPPPRTAPAATVAPPSNQRPSTVRQSESAPTPQLPRNAGRPYAQAVPRSRASAAASTPARPAFPASEVAARKIRQAMGSSVTVRTLSPASLVVEGAITDAKAERIERIIQSAAPSVSWMIVYKTPHRAAGKEG